MTASAPLPAQGWRGEGHTLHKTNDSIGLKNRLLVSRKANTSGLGASQYANDQWWLTALDEQLSGLTTKNGKITGTAKDGKLDRLKDGAGQSELYKFFISGGLLQGTVDKLPTETGGKGGQPASNGQAAIDLKPRSFSISAKKLKTKSTANGSEKETKEERRARKKAKQERRDQKQARREQKQAQREVRKKKLSDTNGVNGVSEAIGETKEERRRRREARRKRKEEKRRSKN